MEAVMEGPRQDAPAQSSAEEQQLTAKIVELWQSHVEAQGTARQSREQLKAIRDDLARSLHTMKLALARPGRNGQWSAFLTAHALPRTTADRLVRGYTKAMGSDENCSTGASDSDATEAEKLGKTTVQRMGKLLATPAEVFEFVRQLVASCGLHHELDERGLIVFKPGAVPMAAEATTVHPMPAAVFKTGQNGAIPGTSDQLPGARASLAL